MGLDQATDRRMRDTYHAYLENTPGSKKALSQILTKKKPSKKIVKTIVIKKSDDEPVKSKEGKEVEENIKQVPEPLQKQVKYKITITTGNSLGAGTDSIVFIEIIGTKGSTKRLLLNGSNSLDKSKDLFEKGKIDIFEAQESDVGKVISVIFVLIF